MIHSNSGCIGHFSLPSVLQFLTHEVYFWSAFKTFVLVLSNVRSLLLLDFQLSVVPGYVYL